MLSERSVVPVERIEKAILQIAGKKVMLDADLAVLYGVKTRVLVQAVKRNLERFPDDFMFQLTDEQFENLRSQIVTSSGWGGRRYPPYAFTEQGVAMLSSVLTKPARYSGKYRNYEGFRSPAPITCLQCCACS